MRVLVSTTAGAGHFGPLVPFARACRAAGHEVVVASPASFASQVDGAGFAHRPFGEPAPELMGAVFGRIPSLSFEEGNEVVVAEVFGRLDAQAALPGVVETVQQWRPDLVLREPCELASLVAAEASGVPHVQVAIGMASTTGFMLRVLDEALAELGALAGLAEGAAMAAMLSTPTFTTVPPVVDGALAGRLVSGRVASDGAPGTVHRFCDTSLTSGGGGLPEEWGDPSHPLVYATFGSVAATLPGFGSVYPDLVAAFADQPFRVLLTTGQGLDPADLGPVPSQVRVERWWPQADVLPQCAATVGHGGFGTTMGALAAGVPQAVVPLFAFDQRANAEHVAAVGAGLVVEGGPGAMHAVPDAVAGLVGDPSFARAARLVAEEIAALPPLPEAVPLLVDLAGG